MSFSGKPLSMHVFIYLIHIYIFNSSCLLLKALADNDSSIQWNKKT